MYLVKRAHGVRGAIDVTDGAKFGVRGADLERSQK